MWILFIHKKKIIKILSIVNTYTNSYNDKSVTRTNLGGNCVNILSMTIFIITYKIFQESENGNA